MSLINLFEHYSHWVSSFVFSQPVGWSDLHWSNYWVAAKKKKCIQWMDSVEEVLWALRKKCFELQLRKKILGILKKTKPIHQIKRTTNKRFFNLADKSLRFLVYLWIKLHLLVSAKNIIFQFQIATHWK